MLTQQEKGLIKFIKKTVKKTKKKKSSYLVFTPKQFKIIMKHAKPYKFKRSLTDTNILN